MNDLFFRSPKYSEIHPINLAAFSLQGYELSILREDLLHLYVSGNKFRKLKYNLREANRLGFKTILTFGGAFSNHIAATAAAGALFNMQTIGVIRGDELAAKVDENPTLSYARSCGMKFIFISRSDYKKKESPDFIKELERQIGDFYLLPEGGTNSLAIQGCAEILSEQTHCYDYICAAMGTGGTVAGIASSVEKNQQVIGFSALKGTFQDTVVSEYVPKSKVQFTDDYCFGGYAKIDSDLVRFINEFKQKTRIQLDPIYTGKMMFGVFDLMKNGKLPKNSRILAVHTGGLQAIPGMNTVLKKKNLPLLL